jgi:hypothetical protein
MNYILHINAFYTHLRKDPRLRSNHISLYLALFQIWNYHHFSDKFPVPRDEALQLSGIGSRNTYTTCMKNLHAFGLITYLPSDRLFGITQVSIKMLPLHKTGTHTGPGMTTPTWPKTETPGVSEPGHFNNKQINNDKESQTTPAKICIPTLEESTTWFSQHNHPPQEARKFFYHYQAIGWTLSGHPIADWQAAAAKWITNTKITKHDKPGRLHTDNNKNYADPL